MKSKIKIRRGSGNVFADLGLPHPERTLARAQIMAHLTGIIQKRGLSQKKTAELLGIPQSKVSCLMNGKLSMFSLDKLFELLHALDTSIEITLRAKSSSEKFAATHVRLAA